MSPFYPLIVLLFAAFLPPVARSAPDVLDSPEACRAALATPPQATVAHDLPPVLRVLSWNVLKYGRDGSAPMLQRLSTDADLVMLQETLRDTPTAYALPHRFFAEGFRSARGPSGVELRSRMPADVVCALSFTEPWLRTPKAVLVTRLVFADRAVLIANLHAINFTLDVDAYGTQLHTVTDLLATHDGPAIVAGDFNNWSEQRQAVVDSMAARAGLRQAQFAPDRRSRHFGVPVDGVLQRGFEFVSATAIPTETSDHHPLVVRLRPQTPVPDAAVGNLALGAR